MTNAFLADDYNSAACKKNYFALILWHSTFSWILYVKLKESRVHFSCNWYAVQCPLFWLLSSQYPSWRRNSSVQEKVCTSGPCLHHQQYSHCPLFLLCPSNHHLSARPHGESIALPCLAFCPPFCIQLQTIFFFKYILSVECRVVYRLL